MSRTLFVLSLLGASLLWPSPATAQTPSGTCEFGLYTNVLNVPRTESGLPAGAMRREIRGREGVPIEVRCGTVLLIAQEIDFLSPEDRLVARGDVVFQQGGTRIAATRGEFDTKAKTGFFENASGSLQLTDKQIDRTLFGTQEPEATFSADRIEKTGDKTYKLTNAVFSACVQPSRRWQMKSSRMSFTVDKYAILYNAVLQVKDVSLLYVPMFYYPINEDGRATGFLMPSYGSSYFSGFTLSNAFFWAINRSMDATVYHDWYTKTGQGFGGDFRYVSGPQSYGNGRVKIIREKAVTDSAGTVTAPARQSFEVRGDLLQTLPGRLRLQSQANFFSDATTQQLYQVDFQAISQRQRSFGADLSGSWGRLRALAQASRTDVFYGTTGATSLQLKPRVNLSVSEAPILGSKVTFGVSIDGVSWAKYLDVDDPSTRTSAFRSDAKAQVRAPLSLGRALSVNSSVSVQQTNWNRSRDPLTGLVRETPLARTLMAASVSVTGPTFMRVFNTPGNGFAERFKHVIEPTVTVSKNSAFDRFDEVLQYDGADTIVGGVTEVSYGITNRLHARVRQGEGPSVSREIMVIDVRQTYYSDALAASYDGRYATSVNGLFQYLAPPGKLSPLSAKIDLRPAPTVNGGFGLEYDTQFGAVRAYWANATVTSAVVDFSGAWSKRQFIPGLVGYDTPESTNHSMTVRTALKQPSGGASAMYSAAFDIKRTKLLQQRITGIFNAQCCGVAFDYSITNWSHLGLRDDKRFTFSFTLAGLGSFTNLLGVFGENGRQR